MMMDYPDDEDDEETLQLKLQAIQARLRLKKIQQSKAAAEEGLDAESNRARSAAATSRAGSAAAIRARQDLRQDRLVRSRSQASVHVPVSPVKRTSQPTDMPRSPGRVLLGIDKGLKASDVSLRRAPSLRKLPPEDQMENIKRVTGFLQRASSQTSNYSTAVSSGAASPLEAPKPKNFSERMADVRNQELERKDKDARIAKARSKAFDINEQDMERFRKTAADTPEIEYRAPQFSRDEVMNAVNKPVSGLLQRSKSISSLASGLRTASNASSASSQSRSSSRATTTPASKAPPDSSEIEPFSSLHLSKRIIPHTTVTRTLSGKRTYTIPELLKEVKAPAFRLPDIEEDIVLLAVIAARSQPIQHKTQSNKEQGAKFMVMTLSDLKWELELYLFDTGFEKFYRLTPGTVIGILNPNIMPPKKADTGRWSLTINSSDDTILEIGTARDLGFCKAVKKDGKTCDSWIDKRHTEICEFHVNEALKKTTAGRMEVNTMDFGPKSRRKGSSFMGGSGESFGYKSKVSSSWGDRREAMERKSGVRYDRDSQSKIYVQPGYKRNSAALLDDVDVDPDAFHHGSKEERMRKRLAAAEKERDIAEKLTQVGDGMGADYMRVTSRSQDQSQPIPDQGLDGPPTPPDAKALGLLDGKATQVSLSPIKRKRGLPSGTSISSTAIGWGGHLTKELGRMRDGERLQPIKKKTRFVTAKGIREAGRESFGGENTPSAVNNDDDDDDDDLDIV
jgi:minichromosome maintenance protein 10